MFVVIFHNLMEAHSPKNAWRNSSKIIPPSGFPQRIREEILGYLNKVPGKTLEKFNYESPKWNSLEGDFPKKIPEKFKEDILTKKKSAYPCRKLLKPVFLFFYFYIFRIFPNHLYFLRKPLYEFRKKLLQITTLEIYNVF